MPKLFRVTVLTGAVAGAAFAGVGLWQALDDDASAAQRQPDRQMRDHMGGMQGGGHMRGMERHMKDMERHMERMERHMGRMERMMERHMDQGDGS